MEAIEQMAAVALVLLLLGATLWVLRRRGFAGIALGKKSLGLRTVRRGRRLECLERLSLGPQHTLHLVRLGDMELLLASSPAGCSLLETLAVETLANREAEAGR